MYADAEDAGSGKSGGIGIATRPDEAWTSAAGELKAAPVNTGTNSFGELEAAPGVGASVKANGTVRTGSSLDDEMIVVSWLSVPATTKGAARTLVVLGVVGADLAGPKLPPAPPVCGPGRWLPTLCGREDDISYIRLR